MRDRSPNDTVSSEPMHPRPTDLFRAEALGGQRRLEGSVSVGGSIAWQTLTIVLLGIVIAMALYLALTPYSRVTIASGTITLDKGVATIVPSRAGIVQLVSVSDGDQVRAGQELIQVRAEERLLGGGTEPNLIANSLQDQGRDLALQGAQQLAASKADQARLQEQIRAFGREADSLRRQRADQLTLLNSARSAYDDITRIAQRGFISRRDLQAREAEVLSRRQQLEQLDQAIFAKEAELTTARKAIEQAGASAQSQASATRVSLSALKREAAGALLAKGYVLVSPFDGVATAVSARPGQVADPRRGLMMIIPNGARPKVELQVPSSAIGFIAPAQEVRIAVDAFPYQQFGTLAGRVEKVSLAADASPGEDGKAAPPAYRVTVDLSQAGIVAFGKMQPLRPGMSISARIITDRRSLLQWLFDPLLAVSRR